MEKLSQYRQVVRQVLSEHAHPYSHSDDVETEIICDTEGDHYQLAYIGWEEQQRIFNLILHFDIKDGKIWVQHNGTEAAIAQELVDKGIPASDIVLGFHSPFKRQFSGYAVAWDDTQKLAEFSQGGSLVQAQGADWLVNYVDKEASPERLQTGSKSHILQVVQEVCTYHKSRSKSLDKEERL